MSNFNQDYLVYVPTIKVYPSGVCTFRTYLSSRRTRYHGYFGDPEYKQYIEDQKSKAQVCSETYSGRVTIGMRRNLSRCLDLLLSSAKLKYVIEPSTGRRFTFRINFVTLTLSDPTTELTDKFIKKHLLDPFLRRMVYRHRLVSFVWKAERQKNGALHFHIVTDTWLPFKSVQDNWNDIQNKHGLLDAYRAKYKRESPHSTEVKAVHRNKEAKAYLAKYLGKAGDEKAKISGRLWGASFNLKRAKYPVTEIDTATSNMIDAYCRKNPDTLLAKDYFSFIKMPDKSKKGNLPPDLLDEYRNLLIKVRNGKF